MLERLGAARAAALGQLGIRDARDLLNADWLRAARMVMAGARGSLPAAEVSGLLAAPFAGQALAEAPAWPVTALRGVTAAQKEILATIGVATLAALVELGVEAEAAVAAAQQDNGFRERPSAPAALLPGLLGAVASTVRFASFIREQQLRGLRFSIDRDCAPDLALSTRQNKDSGRTSLADLLALLKSQPLSARELADLQQRLARAKTPADLAAIVERLAGRPDPVGGLLTDIFERQPCPVFELGYLCGHRQQWINLGTHLGEVVHSISLAPGESRNIAFVNWQRRQRTARTERTRVDEALSASFVLNRALEEITSAVAREHQAGGSSTQANTAATAVSVVGALAIGAGVGAAIGTAVAPGVGTAVGAALGAGVSGALAAGVVSSGAQALGTIESDTSGQRTIVADVQQRISLSTSQHASSVRSLWSTSVVEDTQAEQVEATTSNITNYNHMHALNLQYYEVLQHYLARIELEKIEPLLFLPFTCFDFTQFRFVRDYWDTVRLHLGDEGLVAQGDSYFVTERAPEAPDLVPVPPPIDLRNGRLRDVRLQLSFTYNKAITIKLAIKSGSRLIQGRDETQPTAGDVRFRTFSFPGTIEAGNEVKVIVSVDRKDGGLVKLGLRALEATAENDEKRFQLDDTPVGSVTVANAVRKKDYTVVWNIPDLEPRGAALEEAKNAKERAKARATNEARQLAFDTLTANMARFEERLQRLVLRRRHFFTRVILDAMEPEEIRQLLESVELREDGAGAQSVPLGRIADTTPLGLTHGAFVLKLRRLDAAAAAAVARAAGVDLQKSPQLSALLSHADTLSRHFESAQQDGPLARADHVYVPTSGLFAEAILGRANSAEYLDLERYFNWQDAPIPHQPPPIAAVSTDSRFQQGNVSVNVPEGNLQVINPVTLPDSTGLQSALGAVQNGGLFRDMSKTAELAGVIANLSALSGALGQAAAGMTGEAAQQALQTAGELAQKAGDLALAQSANARTPTRDGQDLGTATNMDNEKRGGEQPTVPTPATVQPTPTPTPTPTPQPTLREQTFRKKQGLPPAGPEIPPLREAMFSFLFNDERAAAVDGLFELDLRMDGLAIDGKTSAERSRPISLQAQFERGLFQQEITLTSQPAPLFLTFSGFPVRAGAARKVFSTAGVFALPPGLINYVFLVTMVFETIEVEASSQTQAVEAINGTIDVTVAGEEDKAPAGAPAPAAPPKKKPKVSKKPSLPGALLSLLSSLVDVSVKVGGGFTDTDTQTDGTVRKFQAKVPTGGLTITLDRGSSQ